MGGDQASSKGSQPCSQRATALCAEGMVARQPAGTAKGGFCQKAAFERTEACRGTCGCCKDPCLGRDSKF